LLFNNIRIYNANRGIGIFQRRKGNLSNMVFSNIIIDSRLYPGQWWGHGEPVHVSALPGLGSTSVGTISNVWFNNIIAKGEQGIVLYGSDESVLKDIHFENLHLTLARGKYTDIDGGNFDLRPTNGGKPGLFKQDIPAFYARYINGLTVKNFEVQWGDSLPDYFTNSIYCEHFEHLTVDGFSGSPAPGAPAGTMAIELQSGNGAVLKNIEPGYSSGRGGGTFAGRLISAKNVKGLEAGRVSVAAKK
jgi:hypothetical protein